MRSRSIVGITLLLSVFALALAGIISFHSMRVLNDAGETLVHTKDVSLALERTLSVLKDAETGQRGYLLTGRDSYLQPHTVAVTEVGREIALLRSLLANDSGSATALAELSTLTRKKLDELAETIRLQQQGDPLAAVEIVKSDRGKESMDAIRALVERMQSAEETKLAAQLQAEAKPAAP